MKFISTKVHAQMGGTLLSLVIGVFIGLTAALAVTVYVNNVPVPFVDRGVTRKPAQDAAEAEHNKGWNPNAGLVGAQTPLPAPTTDGQTGSGPTLLAPGPEDEKPSGPGAQSPDPLGDLAQSKLSDEKQQASPAVAPNPEPPSTPSAPADDKAPPFVYFVQVGAFRTADDANALRAKVALLGMSSQITEREQAGRPVFRVRLGPFAQQTMAEATRDQVTKGGIEATLVRVER